MKLILKLILITLLSGNTISAQYNYFSNWYDLDPPSSAGSGTNLFVVDSGYVTIGGMATWTNNYFNIRKIDEAGNTLQAEFIPSIGGNTYMNSDSYIDVDNEHGILLSNRGGGGHVLANLSYWNHWTILDSSETIGTYNDDTLFYRFTQILRLNDNEYLMAGKYSFDTIDDEIEHFDYMEVVLCKRTFSGETIWKKSLFQQEEDFLVEVHDLDITPNGDILIMTQHGYGSTTDHAIVKANSEGEYLSHYSFGGPHEETVAKMLPLDNGNYVVFYELVTYQDFWIKMVDLHTMEFDPITMLPVPDSDILYETEFTNDLTDEFRIEKFMKTPDGGYVALIYFAMVSDTYYTKSYILKLDANYQQEWMRTYLPPIDSYQHRLCDIEIAHDGGFILSGSLTFPSPQFYNRHWILKLDACGDEVFSGCPTSIEEFKTKNSKFKLWPNPASAKFNISSTQEMETITIKDITGKTMMIEKTKQAMQTHLDISSFASGLYLVEVDFGDGLVDAQKLVVE